MAVPVFENKEEEHLWKCPFCDPESTAYRLNVPASSEVQELRRAKLLIKDHLELHKRDLLNQLATKRELTQYEKASSDSSKRVRLWIAGTISDRQLYEDDTL
ncbi:hypothetical protein HPULCUR_000399 [Helicostylum pulchrum]|uniref:Uncharacterized protein n=1 Tax=Helicostylum pulchrum TaxID=562976 RepID=A0ABP9XKW9_9FUNG